MNRRMNSWLWAESAFDPEMPYPPFALRRIPCNTDNRSPVVLRLAILSCCWYSIVENWALLLLADKNHGTDRFGTAVSSLSAGTAVDVHSIFYRYLASKISARNWPCWCNSQGNTIVLPRSSGKWRKPKHRRQPGQRCSSRSWARDCSSPATTQRQFEMLTIWQFYQRDLDINISK